MSIDPSIALTARGINLSDVRQATRQNSATTLAQLGMLPPASPMQDTTDGRGTNALTQGLDPLTRMLMGTAMGQARGGTASSQMLNHMLAQALGPGWNKAMQDYMNTGAWGTDDPSR